MKRIVLSALVLCCLGVTAYGQRRPISLRQQAQRIAWEQAKRAWEIQRGQWEQAYRERQNERQRYDDALRYEWESHRRAADAERRAPYSWQAERLRQEASRASMQRARAQAAVELALQNSMRSIYGNRVTTVPSRQQFIPVPNQNARSGHDNSDRGGPRDYNEAVDRAKREFRDIRESFSRKP